MPVAELPGGLEMYYEVDDLGDPWRDPETVVLHHGVGKSGRLLFAWARELARSHRVVRLDARGYGRSTVPASGYDWSLEGFAADVRNLLDHLGLERVHLIGETMGGTVALRFASLFPDRLLSVATCSSPFRFRGDPHFVALRDFVERVGVRGWVAQSTRSWFAEDADPRHVAWMREEMGHSPQHVVVETLSYVSTVDLTPRLGDIRTPALVIVGGDGDQLAQSRELVQRMANARLAVIPGVGGYARVQFEAPEACVAAWRDFAATLQPT